MLLTAYLDGRKVDLTRESTQQILDWHEQGQRFEMADGCKKLGRINRSFYGRWAFAHPANSNCPGEHPDHVEAKARLAELCRAHVAPESVEVEYPVPGHPQTIDVMATTAAGVKWALEVQRSGQTPDLTRERTRILNRLGYMVAWFFFRPGQVAGIRDHPSAIHLLADKDLKEVRGPAAATVGRPRVQDMAAMDGPEAIGRMMTGQLRWLSRTTFTHARMGLGTASTFTCRCGAVGSFPQQSPPCRHRAACGFDAGPGEGCPAFDWPKHLWKNPALLPASHPLGLCYMTSRGTWSRCPKCKANIRSKPASGRWREPERQRLEIPVSLPPEGVGQTEVGHWCGLDGRLCHQPSKARPTAKGQARLFED